MSALPPSRCPKKSSWNQPFLNVSVAIYEVFLKTAGELTSLQCHCCHLVSVLENCRELTSLQRQRCHLLGVVKNRWGSTFPQRKCRHLPDVPENRRGIKLTIVSVFPLSEYSRTLPGTNLSTT
ncbi:hypothetical protein BaRGS_00015337 [Batillaria attramentaria]|uniref:Uncharacterized protein n=1 Tax=Batillaria attramentaria TaxID=370345 RepID=A0ABD0L317_9CAEN